MKKKKCIHGFLFLGLAFMVIVLESSARERMTIAVLDFKNNSPTESSDLKPLEQGLADVVITTLTQAQGLKVVERREIKAIFEEMALGQSGVIDESTAQNVGKLLGAQFLVLGSFMKGFQEDIRIDCRIVRTETGLTLKAEQVSGKLKEIIKLMNQLSEKILNHLNVKLDSSEEKAIKQLDAGCSYDVLMDYFRALEFIEKQQYVKADALLTKVSKTCPKFRKARIVQQEMRATLKGKFKKDESRTQ